jgi:Ran GTPase-activating protein (RanGAP) involved in mRNA processing and transport
MLKTSAFISNTVHTCTQQQILELHDCALGDTGGAILARCVGDNRTLTHLGLQRCDLGHRTGIALAKSLKVLYRFVYISTPLAHLAYCM